MAAVKIFFQRFRPLRLYFVLILTAVYFSAQLVVSHVTHALTLLVDSYHFLCNLIALVGCIITVKYGNAQICDAKEQETENASEELKILSTPKGSIVKYAPKNCHQTERALRNTFGWARIDILVMLIGCVFLASLCFSLLVEAFQTLFHISHLDEMHQPMSVLYIGLFGLVLNLICYLMIGGYTFHPGSFLHITEGRDVIVESENAVSIEEKHTSTQSRNVNVPVPVLFDLRKRQNIWETLRDVIGCFLVIICAILVYYTDQHIAKYVDPIISIISALLLLVLSYSHMKESCLILLQTIPNHIDIGTLETKLKNTFPNCIINIHDFHVWQLTANKTISTVHIIFLNPFVYIKFSNDIKKFFEDHGINHVTVQPEFFKDFNSIELIPLQCLVQCSDEKCFDFQCCSSISDLNSVSAPSLASAMKKNETNYLKKSLKITNSLPSSINLTYLPTSKDLSCHSLSEFPQKTKQSLLEKTGNLLRYQKSDKDKIKKNSFIDISMKSELICETHRKIKIDNSLNNRCTSEPINIYNIHENNDSDDKNIQTASKYESSDKMLTHKASAHHILSESSSDDVETSLPKQVDQNQLSSQPASNLSDNDNIETLVQNDDCQSC